MTDEAIVVGDADDGLHEELEDRIYAFNTEATGYDDGRLLRIADRADDGSLRGGLTGWTWGGCAVIDLLWIAPHHRRAGLGSRMLVAAEDEARARGCTHVLVSSHTFQAPDFYRRHSYVEYARTEDSPTGHADIHFRRRLV
ncbi:MAG: GNAT family N-acetyltransferase [Actinomycetota bacterium]